MSIRDGAPALLCDWCGAPIDAADDVCRWRPTGNGMAEAMTFGRRGGFVRGGGDVVFLHRDGCEDEFLAENGRADGATTTGAFIGALAGGDDRGT